MSGARHSDARPSDLALAELTRAIDVLGGVKATGPTLGQLSIALDAIQHAADLLARASPQTERHAP